MEVMKFIRLFGQTVLIIIGFILMRPKITEIAGGFSTNAQFILGLLALGAVVWIFKVDLTKR